MALGTVLARTDERTLPISVEENLGTGRPHFFTRLDLEKKDGNDTWHCEQIILLLNLHSRSGRRLSPPPLIPRCCCCLPLLLLTSHIEQNILQRVAQQAMIRFHRQLLRILTDPLQVPIGYVLFTKSSTMLSVSPPAPAFDYPLPLCPLSSTPPPPPRTRRRKRRRTRRVATQHRTIRLGQLLPQIPHLTRCIGPIRHQRILTECILPILVPKQIQQLGIQAAFKMFHLQRVILRSVDAEIFNLVERDALVLSLPCPSSA